MVEETAVPTVSQTQKSRTFVPSILTSRRALILAAAFTASAGLALNWNWMVAVGIAPVLISVLPCLVMCGLGLCMHKITGRTCGKETGSNDGEPK